MSVIRVRSRNLALLLGAAAILAASPPSARAASILPPRSEEATLLIGVDSARTSVVTMVAVPGSEAKRADRPVRRLIGTAVVLSQHRVLTTATALVMQERQHGLDSREARASRARRSS